MEAVPRLPMISFELKTSTENASFHQPLKQYISQFYGEDPESYNNEIHKLESLRCGAVRPSTDIEGVQIMKKYYCQLHFLKSRFPMEELQEAAVYFSWKDTYSTLACSIPDIRFEMMCILYNIGALHSQLGVMDQRVTPDGMKIACTHFQCAAWAFQMLRENHYQMVGYISSVEVMNFMELVCLAQAQECILEKSMMDNRKATIIAKVAIQVVDYYKKAQTTLQGGVDENNYTEFVQVPVFKEWVKYLSFKIAYHKCVFLLYQGQQAEEQQKMGERVAFYKAAAAKLEAARKISMALEKKQEMAEAIEFTSNVVEGKKKAAINENDYIYHESVPNEETFPEVKGAALVKGIPFNANDVEVSGPDIFSRLVPMQAHEASSLYSEKKAEVLRKYGELIENKDQKLVEFMSSMQIDFLNDIRQATGLPQEIVDRAAALSAMPNAIQNLVVAMTKLSNSYHEVEALLNEIQELLKEEEISEREYQKTMGERPPSIIATDISREAAKYYEAHTKANDSNQNLHKVMMTHVSNLRILSEPLSQLMQQIPSVEIPDKNVDEAAMKEIEMLLAKVEEMKNQRAVLWAQLRDALHRDDITSVLVTKRSDQTVDTVFKQELGKHQQLITLIEQNAAAQENIIKAFIDAYARFSNTRRYLQGIITKRQTTVNSLVTSFDCYEDLLAKATKGVEFYNKLEGNITKLAQRIRSATKVQQEEREQMLAKKPAVYYNTKKTENVPEPNTPKLKDVLKSYKAANSANKMPTPGCYPNTGSFATDGAVNQAWPPGVRPTPVGSEMTDFKYDSIQTYQGNVDSNIEQRMGALNVNENYNYYAPNSGYVAQNFSQGSYAPFGVEASGNVPDTKNSRNALGTSNVSNSGYVAQNLPQGSYASFGVEASGNVPDTESSRNALGASNVPNSGYLSQNYSQDNYASFGVESSGNVPDTKNLKNVLGVSNAPNSGYVAQNFSHGNYASFGAEASGNVPDATNSNNATGASIAPNYNQYIPMQYQSMHTTNIQTTPSNYVYSNQSFQNNTVQSDGSVNYGNLSPQVKQTSNLYDFQGKNYGNSEQNVQNQFYAYQNAMASGSYQSYDYQHPNEYVQNQPGFAPTPTNYGGSNVPYTECNVPTCYSGSSTYSTNTVPDFYGGPTSTNTLSSYASSGGVNPENYGNSNFNQTNYGNFELNTNTLPTSQIGYSAYGQTTFQGDLNYANYTPYTLNSVDTPVLVEKEKEPSTIDLLSGLEFTIDQVPLEPQQREEKKKPQNSETKPVKNVEQTPKVENVQVQDMNITTPVFKIVSSKPLDNDEVKRLFRSEVEKYEKFVDVLSMKTLSGPTTLELKWKEIQDTQENESAKKIISVARCYPMKNRFPDILPYDHSRVILHSTKDDYINASYIKDISQYAPLTIVTQAPLQSTIFEFWTMLLENQVEFVLCLSNDSEINSDKYWPSEKGKWMSFGNLKITLESVAFEKNFVKRLITINVPEKKESSSIVHLQFTEWPGSLFPASPGPFVDYIKEALSLYQQQKPHKPLVIHCSSGIGKSGVACLLMFAILEATNNSTSLPDITFIANRITSFRKNILRDREHLKFAYQAFLFYVKKILSDDGSPQKIIDAKKDDEKKMSENDPLNSLDPFWVVGKDKK